MTNDERSETGDASSLSADQVRDKAQAAITLLAQQLAAQERAHAARLATALESPVTTSPAVGPAALVADLVTDTMEIGRSAIARLKNPTVDAGGNAALSAHSLEQTGINHYHSRTGHGHATEDANHINDFLRGRDAQHVGRDNALNGADRFVDGVLIQTKCCATPRTSFDSCFDKVTRLFRYPGMEIEVPPEQRDEVVRLMREAIADGRVPGVTDPARADGMVRASSVTYEQAKNLARAGTIDGLVFDMKQATVTLAVGGSLSFAVSFATRVWSGESKGDALKGAVVDGLAAGLISMSVRVGTAQILRTQAARHLRLGSHQAVRLVVKTDLGKQAVKAMGRALLGNSKANMRQAIGAVTKVGRSNAIAGAATVVVTSVPDLYRASVSGTISWAQMGKNFAVNGASVAGGTAGWWAGAAAGTALGSVVPVLGNGIGFVAGGLIGGLGGGQLSNMLARKVLGHVVEDDAEKLLKELTAFVQQMAVDYALTQGEFDAFAKDVEGRITPKFLKQLQANKARSAYLHTLLSPVCLDLLMRRPKVMLPSTADVTAAIDEVSSSFGFELVTRWSARSPRHTLHRCRSRMRRSRSTLSA